MGLLSTLGGLAGTFLGGPLGGTVGGLLGGGLEGGDTNGGAGATSATATKTPWGPAQQYLMDNLKTNADMQGYYQRNPFNAQQKAGLQNTLTDADQFRSQVAPGLMNFANGAMSGGYQRQVGGAPGSGAGYGGDRRTMQQSPSIVPTSNGPFSAAPTGQSFGQIDWNAINPHNTQNQPVAAAATPAAALPPEYAALLEELRMQKLQQEQWRGNGGGFGGFGGGLSDGGFGNAGSESA